MIKKPLLGNDEYLIDIDGCLYHKDSEDVYGDPDASPSSKITLSIFGQYRTSSRKMFAVCSFYELSGIEMFDLALIGPITNRLVRNKIGYWLRFKEMIHFKDGYYYCPEYCRYAVNKDSEVMNVITGAVLSEVKYNKLNYMYIDVYNPIEGKFRTCAHHRVVALTWCKNEYPSSEFVVDHVDGNPSNNSVQNLEWVTNAENLRRGVAMSDKYAYKITLRNVLTEEIIEIESSNDLFNYVGLKRASLYYLMNRKFPHFIKPHWEWKLRDSDYEWQYSEDNLPLGKSSSRIYVTWEDGREDIIYGCIKLKAYVNTYIKRSLPNGTKRLAALLRTVEGITNVRVDYRKPLKVKKSGGSSIAIRIMAVCQSTGKKTYHDSIRAAAREINGVDRRSVSNSIKENRPISNYQFYKVCI